ncbi:MAG TPA: efflux RND transporter permease subunit, partial [Sumerlaeia bacterium]|nr:efflux RND transporter permease subunit [Sumerlaeia bacterium]
MTEIRIPDRSGKEHGSALSFDRFVHNPVKVSMLFLALALMGGLSYRKLPLNLFPDVQTPRITLVAKTKGLTPEETERQLTRDFERQLASIKGVASVTTFSREDSIVAHLDFHWDQDMEFAYLDVKKNVGLLEADEKVEKIDVYRFDPNSAPLMTLAFTPLEPQSPPEASESSAWAASSPNLHPSFLSPGWPAVDRVQITSFVENSLRPKLETIEGVAYVKANGTSRREVTVLVNEDAMARYDLTTDKIVQAIRNYSA